jgi:transcriptional regulator with XRE-family HTH domain
MPKRLNSHVEAPFKPLQINLMQRAIPATVITVLQALAQLRILLCIGWLARVCSCVGHREPFAFRGARGNTYSLNSLAPHEQLKEIRSKLGITTREVSEFSHKIAESEGNPEFHISNAWLTQVENSDSVPSIFKLYSLSSIYRIKFTDLLRLYGVDMQRLHQHQLAAPLPQTHMTTLEVYDPERTVSFPVRFDRSFDLDNTNLLSRMIEIWGEVPIALIQHLDVRHGLYGYVGLQDSTLYPLLRPGSFVQIDPRVRKIQPLRWRTEFDRPIYFLELRDGYACSWCDLQDGHLLLLPHPLSPASVRRLKYGADVEIVGQVTAVAMRLAEVPDSAADGAARLPKRV